MKKKILIEIGLLAVLAGVLGFYVHARLGMRMAGTPPPLESPFATEEDWLLDEILRDIAEMSAYAGGGRTADVELSFGRLPGTNGPLPAIRVEVGLGKGSPPVSKQLALEGSFWNPANYAGLALDLLGPDTGRGAEPTGGDDRSLLEALLEPRASVIEKENERVSSRLAANRLDPVAHEEAALLLGAFALRESPYRFGDLRQLRCRITAHLAMARALRRGEAYGPSGRFADAALSALVGRQVEALEALDRLSAGATAAESAWVSALFMYVTSDWRRPANGRESLFEKLQRFRAMVATLGSTAAADRMGKELSEDLPDWGRAVAWVYQGAASDRWFITQQMGKELAELKEVWTLVHAKEPLLPERLADALNVPAVRCLSPEGPRVISWGTWAGFFQRHICGLISIVDQNLRRAIGVPERAELYGLRADVLFEGLVLYPMVQVHRTRRPGGRVEDTLGMPATVALARRHPELINVYNWNYMADTASHMVLKWGMPRAETWFSRSVLLTSTFDAPVRLKLLRRTGNEDEAVAALRAMAPRSGSVANFAMDRLPSEELTVDEVVRAFGERLDYDIYALRWMRHAARDRPEEERSALERMCALDANECVALGWALVRAGREEEATAVFERAVDEAPDRVHVCNSVGWLVHHYFDLGLGERALEVAEMAADVYCAGGLITMAELLERMDRLDEAERWYKANEERYGADEPASCPLLGFYYRMARVRGSSEYASRFDRLARRVFPEDLEPLPNEPDAAPPQDGVFIDGDSKTLREAGLRGADVIVGLDGWRVHTLEQYDAILCFDFLTEDMQLRVWRQAQYLDLDRNGFGRHFHARVRTFGTPGPSVVWR